jgi:hypothetical protein
MRVISRPTERERGRAQVSGGQQPQQPGVARGDGAVDRLLGEPRSGDLERGGPEQHQERAPDRKLVRPQVTEEPTHETRVVGLPEDVFVVVAGRFGHGATGSVRSGALPEVEPLGHR